MAVEYYQRILAEAAVVSDQLLGTLSQQDNSSDETHRVILGLTDWHFRVMDTENPFRLRVFDENGTTTFTEQDLKGESDTAKINALKPALAQPSGMVAQATLEHFVPKALSAALGKPVKVTYRFEGTGYKQPKYFEVRVDPIPSPLP